MQQHPAKKTEVVSRGNDRHEIQITPETADPLYLEAFYPREEDWQCEYTLNTTAWD